MFVVLQNAVQDLAFTNYWDSDQAQAGLFYLSSNAGAWRLLVPDAQAGALTEMSTGRFVEAELEVVEGRRCVLLWFVDGSRNPFCLLLDRRQVNGAMVPTATRQPLLIYSRNGLAQATVLRKVIGLT